MEDKYWLLYCKEPEGYPKLIIPESLVSVIKDNHDCKWSLHAGMKKTHKWLISNHYWPRLHQDVEACIHCCDTCAQFTSVHITANQVRSFPLIVWLPTEFQDKALNTS
jgi:hypothetical protein